MSEVLFYVIEERYEDDTWTVGFCSKIPETEEDYEKINKALHISKEYIDELFQKGITSKLQFIHIRLKKFIKRNLSYDHFKTPCRNK